MEKINLFWFRRDLRLKDNQGLFHALKKGNVLAVFIFDKQLLNRLENKNDLRIHFIHQELKTLQQEIKKHKSTLHVLYDNPLDAFKTLNKQYEIQSVYFNHDYEPYARERDQKIKEYFAGRSIPVYTYKDQVIFEKNELLKNDGTPYTVYTPYAKKWKERFHQQKITNYPSEKHLSNLHHTAPLYIPSIRDIGFNPVHSDFPEKVIQSEKITHYDQTRDIPALNGTSKLSVHLRFGTLSIRELIKTAAKLNETYLNELIWREFYMMILWHFPRVTEQSFKKQYDNIEWRNDEKEFEAWCNGNTGYPIVDAGMRELNNTGYMHNRLRMITASFLTKHLLIDWRWGEAYFAGKLLDYELASNNGGWQWAAGTGCDAAPYFRVFNPDLQTKKFDPELKYIKKWVPELTSKDYPDPIVEHKSARERALKKYKQALKE
ncbi:MAG: deoxyribodipyrimidine photo-lyase [Bacteroidales bacterium]|jgi:deoxyribodipyrimidine photo-lyase|nr:deoxyribodipyrimidine photo-lyase [Bacteroidales bacterium]